MGVRWDPAPAHSLSCSLCIPVFPGAEGGNWGGTSPRHAVCPAGHGEGAQLRRDEVQAVSHGEHGARALQEAQRRALLGPGAQRVRARVHGLSRRSCPATRATQRPHSPQHPIKDIFFKTNRRRVFLGNGAKDGTAPGFEFVEGRDREL